MRTLREWIGRLLGTLHSRRHDTDMEEELRLHLELAAEDARRRGLNPADAARSARIRAGGASQAMDTLRDQRGLPWLDAAIADVIFAWRQLKKHRVASAAAILSLGLAIGATTAAFRLVDAVLLRPLPVAEPGRLFALASNSVGSKGESEYGDVFDYPSFRRYSDAVGRKAALMVIGMNGRAEVVVGTADEAEPVRRQYLSGNVFPTFGLQPALGRLLTPSDDRKPGAHPVAVISYDFWVRRYGRDPEVVGKTFRWGRTPIEIIGVSPKGFTGTEPGQLTDVFVPATMNWEVLDRPGFLWFRIWARPNAGASPAEIRQLLQAEFSRDRKEEVESSKAAPRELDAYVNEQILLLPAGSGVSGLQRTLRRPLLVLAALVVLVLLIACANVANLLNARAITRAHEMALRVSIGAGQWRLVQLVLVESALLAIFALALGTLFAWLAVPLVVSLLAPLEDPVRLVLGTDRRVIAFAVALTMSITLLFGLAPAMRASSVKPVGRLKTSRDVRHRRLTHSLIGAQTAFCVFVLFVAGLFVSTFENLSNRPLGFAHERVLLLEINLRGQSQPPEVWKQVTDRLRAMAGVESVAVSMWAPLSQNRWLSSVRVPGRDIKSPAPYALGVSPGFFDTLRVGIVAGRDFRLGDKPPRVQGAQHLPGVGIVSEAFARVYFDGQNPVGRQVSVRQDNGALAPMEIVGLVRDVAYWSVREPMHPTVYVPNEDRNEGALIIRTAADPLVLAPTLRSEVTLARSDFRVTNAGTQSALVRRQMIRERLLATLSLFFAIVAIVLAGIGLYGVLNYAVIQRRREIGVRMALGAHAAHVVRGVTADMLGPVAVGSVIGLVGGLAFGRVVQALLFEVRTTHPATLVSPLVTLVVMITLAALPPVIRAVRIDPAQTLRSE